jgi:hypothetical protein
MSKKQFATILGMSMLSAFIGGGLAVQLLSVPSALAQRRAFFDYLTIGKVLNVKSWLDLGHPGVEGGKITFESPDRSAGFFVDHPGNWRLRFSTGRRPGDREVMSLSSQGSVKIHGNLQVMGLFLDRHGNPFQTGQARRRLPPIARARVPGVGGKGDYARSIDLQMLQDQVNVVWSQLEQLRQRVNLLSQ